MKNLIIIGDGKIAELAKDYFLKDSKYKPIIFAVDEKYRTRSNIDDFNVISIKEMEEKYNKDEYYIFIAISSTKLNVIREYYFNYFDKKGYKFASYISSNAFVWHDVKLGKNLFILENNVIQKGCIIEDNVTLWSGNHIGHETKIKKNVFITSHVCISGFCIVGKNSYIGVNSTLINNILIEDFCFVNAGCLIKKNCKKYSIINTDNSKISKVNTKKYFKLNEI